MQKNVTRLTRLVLLGALSLSVAGGTGAAGAQRGSPRAPDLLGGLTWRCVGPFDGGPVASVTGVPGEPGVYVATTPSGGAWRTIDGGQTWASVDRAPAAASIGDPHQWIDPANPRRIVRTDAQGIEVSLNGGGSWMASHHLPIAEVAHLTPRAHAVETRPRAIDGTPANVSVADPARAGLVFAGTNDAVYVSFDNGIQWQPLRLNMPGVAINDLDIRGNDLVAATQGRSIWTLEDISPLRQIGAASAASAAILFRPADAVLPRQDSGADASSAGLHLDYYIGALPGGQATDVTLEILDAAGRVVHAATSAAPDLTDRWLPVTPTLSAAPGHHRVVWNLRVDPPSSPHHRFAHFARSLFAEMPADPDGPQVPAGAYQLRLAVGTKTYAQPLVVRNDPRIPPTALQAERQQFDLAMKAYDAMGIAHRGFLQLARVRAGLKPLLTSPDQDLAAAAGALEARLAVLDGSDWTGLVIPDADDELVEVDEKEGKHPDFVPPKPVSVSKDYDDPTSILGRRFANVDHAPAFAILTAALGDLLTSIARAHAAPDALAIDTYDGSCRQLASVLASWQTMNGDDLVRLNAALAARNQPTLPVAASVPSIACGVGRR